MMRYWDCGYGYSGMSWVGEILMSIFWIVLVVLSIALIRRMLWSGGGMTRRTNMFHGEGVDRRNNSLDIIKERYAKGEINKAEFDEKKKDLESS